MPEQLKPCPACGSDNVECLVCTINADEKQDIHFHIACESCYTSGPIADNGKIAADKWNSLPRALTWTTEPPKVAGWYWWRTSKGQNVSILRIWSRSGVFGYCFASEFITELSRGEWAGPIPAPLEPEES